MNYFTIYSKIKSSEKFFIKYSNNDIIEQLECTTKTSLIPIKQRTKNICNRLYKLGIIDIFDFTNTTYRTILIPCIQELKIKNVIYKLKKAEKKHG